jgi:hypothetical protein
VSLTKNQYPAAYTPNFNDQTFEYTSTQTGQSDFKYIIVATDVITSATQTYNVKQAPNTAELKWYANVFTNQYIKHYIPNNAYGFQKCADAIRQITIEVKEYYGGVTYAASPPSTTTYIVWNGVLRTLDWVDYDLTDFVYKSSTSNFKYITSDNNPSLAGFYTSNKVTYDDKSHFLYCLSSENNDLEFIRINAYDSNGNLLHYSDIANPYAAGTTYTDKYVCIDVGHKGLSQISAGLVTGTYPIITDQVAYYDVIDAYTQPPATARQNVSRIYIYNSCNYEVYTIHYLAKSGNFETLHFPKKSTKREDVEKKTYRKNPNTLSSNQWKYTKFSEWEKVLSSTGQDNFILNTDWLTEDEMELHKEIISSPRHYLDFGSTIGLVPIKVLNTSINIEPNGRNLMGITLEVQPTYKNNYQHG